MGFMKLRDLRNKLEGKTLTDSGEFTDVKSAIEILEGLNRERELKGRYRTEGIWESAYFAGRQEGGFSLHGISYGKVNLEKPGFRISGRPIHAENIGLNIAGTPIEMSNFVKNRFVDTATSGLMRQPTLEGTYQYFEGDENSRGYLDLKLSALDTFSDHGMLSRRLRVIWEN